MLFPILAVLVGFALLVGSADRCVMGVSVTARNFGIPPLLIGLTIAGVGTSSPEIVKFRDVGVALQLECFYW